MLIKDLQSWVQEIELKEHRTIDDYQLCNLLNRCIDEIHYLHELLDMHINKEF